MFPQSSFKALPVTVKFHASLKVHWVMNLRFGKRQVLSNLLNIVRMPNCKANILNVFVCTRQIFDFSLTMQFIFAVWMNGKWNFTII